MIVANKGFLVFLFCFVLFSGRFMYGTISVHGHVAELLGVGHTRITQYYFMEENSLGRKLKNIVK